MSINPRDFVPLTLRATGALAFVNRNHVRAVYDAGSLGSSVLLVGDDVTLSVHEPIQEVIAALNGAAASVTEY